MYPGPNGEYINLIGKYVNIMYVPAYPVPNMSFPERGGNLPHQHVHKPVAPVAYQDILEPGVSQSLEFESPPVYTREICSESFLCTNRLAESART